MKFTETILHGIGQVFFQNNWLSGMVFLIGIFYNSWVLGAAALVGAIMSTASAQLLKYRSQDIQKGLYGFNGTLIGIGIMCIFEVTAISIIALIVGAVLSTIVTHFLKKIILPFTAPFILVTWLSIFLLLFIFKVPFINSSPEIGSALNEVEMISIFGKSFGQVMFQENTISGFLFLIAIFINDKTNAFYAIYAALLAPTIGWLISEPATNLNAGLLGYNSILCAIALSGRKKTDLLWVTLAIILSTFLYIGFAKSHIFVLTAPFVAATWIVLFLKNRKVSTEKIHRRRNKLHSQL